MSISQRKLRVRQDIHVSKTRVCEAKPKQWHKRIRFWCQDIKHLEHGSNDFICFCSSYLTELDDGTIFRKPLRVRVKPWFPVGFPLNQSIDYHYTSTRDIAYRPTPSLQSRHRVSMPVSELKPKERQGSLNTTWDARQQNQLMSSDACCIDWCLFLLGIIEFPVF